MYFGFSNSIVARFENKRKERCKILQVLKLLITRSGHFSDRTFLATPVMVRFSSLLSVINIDSLICLSPGGTSFVHFIALFGKAATALCRQNRGYAKKEEWDYPTPLPVILANQISNQTVAETSLFPLLF
ncbi:hypothetical protein [uncultured Succiniclasticum sp.]|uniref:hypothetical protein n=1 Tax=uncultured Succiniclasticum sp. TaxID=1500547 RepID=UPI0025F11833|nr:hypothetical protein [uncultured Succiniclasticum sp.]